MGLLGCLDGQCAIDLPEGTQCEGQGPGYCVEGLYCSLDEDSGLSSCQPILSADSPCRSLYDTCEAGYQCNDDTCIKAHGSLDEPCGGSGCEEGLFCDNNDICIAKSPEEGVCEGSYQCEDGLLCADNGQCYPPRQGEGEPCPMTDDEGCADGLFCDRETGTCQPPRDEEQMCNPFFPLDSCVAVLYCACISTTCMGRIVAHDPADVCQPVKANGATCVEYSECLSEYCNGEECAEYPMTTEPTLCTRLDQ
jgi:hypothetical protein